MDWDFAKNHSYGQLWLLNSLCFPVSPFISCISFKAVHTNMNQMLNPDAGQEIDFWHHFVVARWRCWKQMISHHIYQDVKLNDRDPDFYLIGPHWECPHFLVPQHCSMDIHGGRPRNIWKAWGVGMCDKCTCETGLFRNETLASFYLYDYCGWCEIHYTWAHFLFKMTYF